MRKRMRTNTPRPLVALVRYAVIAMVMAVPALAQPDTTGINAADTSAAPETPASGSSSSATTRPWYDTLTVTKPRYAYASPIERLALAAFTALSLPVGATIGALTLLPPSINVLVEDGTPQTGFAISSGIGFGVDTTGVIFFPDYRLQFEGAYFFTREQSIMVRAAVLFDKPLMSVHRRDFFWLGIAGGAGVSTDFREVTPYAEGWIGVMNPMGIRFLTLFPQHNYGLRGRAGYDFGTGRPWYELALCATSTFW